MTSYQEQIDALAKRVTALEGGPIPGRVHQPPPREPQPGDEELFGALRAWRYDRAKVEGLPPYRVFGDAVLTAISTAKPSDKFELSKVRGIGPEKMELYGDDVIGIVRVHLDW
jgi:ATP-dependent DNA helicase RecQ